MSTTPDVIASTPMPALPASGGSAEDRFASKLSSAMETGPSQAEAPTPETAETPIEEAPETGASEQIADATAPETGVEEPNPYDEPEESPADQKVVEQFLRTPRGREIYAQAKLSRELSKPSSEGGIGHVPSVADIRSYFDSHRAAVQMYADFSSGDPRRLGGFLAHWFGPQNPAAGQALDNLEPMLAQFGPQAYGRIAAPVLDRFMRGPLREAWGAEKDPNAQAALYKAIQTAYHAVAGEWLPLEIFTEGQAPQSNGTSAERQQIAAEWGRLNTAREQGQREINQHWDAKLGEAEAAILNGEIDKALKPLADMKAKTPVVYESIRERFAKEIAAAATSDPQTWAVYQARVEQVRRAGGSQEEVVQTLLPVLVSAIASKRPAFLKGAGVVVKQSSDDRHAQLRRIASNTVPSNTGVPVKKSVVPASARKPGESRDDYAQRRVVEAMLA